MVLININIYTKKMVNASNSAQRKASGDCEKEFLSSSSLAEELEQNFDVLLLDQDLRQHCCAANRYPDED